MSIYHFVNKLHNPLAYFYKLPPLSQGRASAATMSKQRIQRNFVLAVSSRLKCAICFDVFLKPRRLFCGHTFCKPCLQQLCSKQHMKNPQQIVSCPLCRSAIEIQRIGHDEMAIKIIDDLQVTCGLLDCPWQTQGKCKELNKHYKECSVLAILNEQQVAIISATPPHKKKPDVVSVLSQDESISQGQLLLPERVSAEEYFYQDAPPVPIRKMLVSRGVQTRHVEPAPIEIPLKRRRRRRRNAESQKKEGITFPRRRCRRQKLQNEIKAQTVPPITQEEDLKDIEQMYNTMGFDFHKNYEQVNKAAKPLVVNVDIQRQLLTERW